jgi:caa(3)-type oxidase subunit IV
MAESPEEFQKHIRSYLMVGVALLVFTVVTVVLGVFPVFDLGAPGVSPSDIVLGLAIASFKTSLVMLIFMHLNHERGLIYKTLLFTSAFALSLMGLTLFAQNDPVTPHAAVVDPVPAAQAVAASSADGGHADPGSGH